MSIEIIGRVLREIGIEAGQITADARLRADLALDSTETSELELELERRLGVTADLWDSKDYTLGELAALAGAAGPPPAEPHRMPAERARRYREAGWWRPETLDAVVLRRARTRPEACALVAGNRRVSHGELAALVDGVAGRLTAMGIGRGDPVVVQLPNSVEYVALVLALIRIGAPPVLTTPTLREYELDRVLGLVRPSAMAVPGRTRRVDHLAVVRELRARHPSLTRVFAPGGGEGPEVADLLRLCAPASGEPAGVPGNTDPGDIALMLLSSGTTGPPKVIARTHEDYGHVIRSTSAVAAVGENGENRGNDENTVYLAVMPATHTFVLAYPGVLGTLAAGGTVVLDSAEDPRRTLELIQRERVTHAAAVPGLVTQWLSAQAAAPRDLSSLRVLQVGGARLDPDLAKRASSELPCVVQQVYGMSEGLANYTRLDDTPDVIFGTQGRPACPADEIRVVDENENPVRPGEVGQLLTRGPSTVAGYYRDPEATARAFTPDGFYRTGDLVRQRPDGNLEITGRIKNLINRGGEKICAEELEELVRQMPQVSAACAVPQPHPVHGETVCLFLVADGEGRPDLREVRRYLESRGLARYKLPERLEHIDAMPLIGVGKLDRAALRERVAR